MPRIHLKPNSVEYADERENHRPTVRCCDMPGCPAEGEYRAPKDRSLSGHYWFCMTHVQEYNKAWNFFAGMSSSEIEEQIIRSALWDRPTKRYDPAAMEENLYKRAWQTYHYTEKEPPKSAGPRPGPAGIDHNSPEFQALSIMGLAPPLDLKIIKARYKELAKKHHPDLNPGDPQAEELLKSINMAYTILMLAFEKYEKLPDRNG